VRTFRKPPGRGAAGASRLGFGPGALAAGRQLLGPLGGVGEGLGDPHRWVFSFSVVGSEQAFVFDPRGSLSGSNLHVMGEGEREGIEIQRRQ
jgi:hypothetical protein